MADKKAYSVTGIYTVSGDKVERKNPVCPKCGPGVFLAVHKNRKTCGKCGYTEKASEDKPKEEAKKSE